MYQPTYYQRKSLNDWSCQDVDILYEKISKVGSGTYGEVNKARLRSDPTQYVALKKIKDQSETQGFPITAMREINLLQQCSHPNIIRLYNVVTSNLPDPDRKKKKKRGSTFLVFEYMEHELLGLIQTYQFTTSQVKCIMRQILQGLDYIHSKNIIHRDIKSANILMNNQGEVKIADFGLARKIEPSYNGKLTLRVVTRWYRAPELLLGSKKYTAQIDIWALGCVFAELLMGKSHALFPAQKTPDQFALICETCGIPSDFEWPGHKDLPFYNTMVPKKHYPRVLMQYMRKQNKNIDPVALDLLDQMLTFNPETRINTKRALEHPYFHTSPFPCEPYEMPKFDKDCHAYVLNLKRKAKASMNAVVNPKNIPVDNSYLLNKAPMPAQNTCQSNLNFYEPINMMQGQQAKSIYGLQNYGAPVNSQQQSNENIMNMSNGAYNQYMPQNTPNMNTCNMIGMNNMSNMNNANNMNNMTNMSNMNNISNVNNMSNFNNMNNMKPMNGLVNLNHSTSQMSQMSDMNGYNNMNMMNMSHLPTLGRVGSMHSTNTNTYANTNNNFDNFTDISNMSNHSSLSNISNISNISNMTNMNNMSNMNNTNNMSSMANMSNLSNNMNNMNNTNNMNSLNNLNNIPLQSNTSVLSKQSSNAPSYNYPNNYNLSQDKYLNYLNYQYQQLLMNSSMMHPYMNTNVNPMMPAQVSEYIPPVDSFMPQIEPEKSKQNKAQKPKAQSKRSKPAKNQKPVPDTMDDKKVLETLNELDFDFLDFYNSNEGNLNCKRKGSPAFQDLDQLVKKRQLNDPLGVE